MKARVMTSVPEPRYVQKAKECESSISIDNIVDEYSTDPEKVYNTIYINTVVGNIEASLLALRGNVG